MSCGAWQALELKVVEDRKYCGLISLVIKVGWDRDFGLGDRFLKGLLGWSPRFRLRFF